MIHDFAGFQGNSFVVRRARHERKNGVPVRPELVGGRAYGRVNLGRLRPPSYASVLSYESDDKIGRW